MCLGGPKNIYITQLQLRKTVVFFCLYLGFAYIHIKRDKVTTSADIQVFSPTKRPIPVV